MRRLRRIAAGLGVSMALAAGTLVALDRFFPPPIERGRIVSTVVTDRDGRPLRAFPVEDGRWRLAADVSEIDPAFIEALIRVEDKRFYDHHGVDGLAALRAIRSAVTNGEVTSGASTLTMQTARLLEPRPRNIGSKLIECFRAVQLERRLSKDEILELYLTLAPYGGNIEGVRSAAYAWFGRPPSELTPDQIALLLALPQSPEVRRPDLRPGNATAARNVMLTRLSDYGLIDTNRARDAEDEPVPRRRQAFPAEAWHASETLRRLATAPGDMRSTLDWALQAEATRLVQNAAITSDDGVQVSALIVEIDGRAVRAAVGSAGRDRDGGWIDLTDRRRSPGSALKPFIYGMAFDDGTIAPGTLINDLPSRFASYRPENFDRTFRGEVTIRDALQHSLNVPAVRVLDSIGANRFLAALDFAGGDPLLPASGEVDAGLAIALGGLGITVRDVSILYAALGDGGVALPLAWSPEAAAANREATGYPFMSAESAGEVRRILEGAPPPPGRIPSALSAGTRKIAYKTGTSYGFRDAWAAGISGGYAIVVWTGHPDGTPRPGVTGREAAAPVLFELFDAVYRPSPGISDRRDDPGDETPPAPLARFMPDDAAPVILFPPDEAEVWADGENRGFVLSARGDGTLSWYADGRPVNLDAGGAAVWRPDGPGFYRLVVVDGQGQSTAARVRVRMPNG